MKKTKKDKTPADSNVNKTNNVVIRIRSIDALWGVETNKYKQKNLEDYTKFIEDLNDMGLEDHARDIGVSPYIGREVIIKQLVDLFTQDLKSKDRNRTNVENSSNSISDELNKKLIRIMNS